MGYSILQIAHLRTSKQLLKPGGQIRDDLHLTLYFRLPGGYSEACEVKTLW